MAALRGRGITAACVVLLAGCGADGAATSESTGTSVSTTVVETTAAATTSSVPAVGTWSQRCTEYVRDSPAATEVDEAALETFGPLAVEPALTITLPSAALSTGPSPLVPSMARIPGGVLIAGTVAMIGYGPPESEGSIVMAVDLDGGIRWTRCLDRTVYVRQFAPVMAAPTTAYVVYVDPEGAQRQEFHTISLADGTLGALPSEAPADIPIPDTWAGVAPFGTPDQHFEFRDGGGSVLWEDATLADCGGESQHWSSLDGITIISGCLLPVDADFRYSRAVTRAYRSSDGRLLWELPGFHNLGPRGDGYTLVEYVDVIGGDDTVTWSMIEEATGRPVSGQLWPNSTTFASGCCDDRHTLTTRDGGVVLHSDLGSGSGTVIRVYYPIDAGFAPRTVTLP